MEAGEVGHLDAPGARGPRSALLLRQRLSEVLTLGVCPSSNPRPFSRSSLILEILNLRPTLATWRCTLGGTSQSRPSSKSLKTLNAPSPAGQPWSPGAAPDLGTLGVTGTGPFFYRRLRTPHWRFHCLR